MALLMRPVLSFCGCDDGQWHLSAVVWLSTAMLAVPYLT